MFEERDRLNLMETFYSVYVHQNTMWAEFVEHLPSRCEVLGSSPDHRTNYVTLINTSFLFISGIYPYEHWLNGSYICGIYYINK